MAADQNDEILSLKQQLVEKDQQLARLNEEKNTLEENLDEQEENLKEVRRSFQKQIEELKDDIDEKDEQLDSLSQQIASLENNNKKDVSGTATAELDLLNDKLRQKDSEVLEMREKLTKGGMTINNLHMEIRELKNDLGTANEKVSEKTTKMKDMREENAKLKSSCFELQQKLESVQTSSEPASSDTSVGTVQIEVLKKEMDRKNEELMSARITLEKCQKELSDLKQKQCKVSENVIENVTHSYPEIEKTESFLEDYNIEKSKNSQLKAELDKAQSDLKRVLVFIASLVIAYIIGRLIF